MPEMIYRLMEQQSWLHAKSTGVFEGSDNDRRDGFIHFSTAATLRETAKRYYSDVAELMVLSVRSEELGDDLKWEVSRDGALFPHLYAGLQTARVHEAILLKYTHNGHVFGSEIL